MGRYFFTIQKKVLILLLSVGLFPAVVGVVMAIGGSRLSIDWAMSTALKSRASDTAYRLGQLCERRQDQLVAIMQTHGADLDATVTAAASLRSLRAVIRYRSEDDFEVRPLGEGNSELAARLQDYRHIFERYYLDYQPAPRGFLTDLSLRLTEGSARATGMALSAFSEPGGGMIFFLGRGDDLLDQVRQFTSAEGDKIYIFSRKGYMLTTLADPLDLTSKAAERIEKSFGALPEWFAVQTEDQNHRGRHLVAYSAIPGLSGLRPDDGVSSPWALLISYDMENFLSPLARLFWATLIAASVWMLALLGISVVAARRVVGPVKQLRYQAEQMTSGQLDSRAQVHSGDEIQDLAEAFNTMADRLSASHRDLEARVEENRLRAEHINVINEITKAITQDPDIDRTFEILKRDLKKILQYDGLWIALAEEETGKLKVTHAEPAAVLPLLQDDRLALEYSFHGPTVREKITSVGEIDPTQDTDSFDSGVFVSLDFKSYLVAPLPSVNRVLGALTVVSKESDAYGKDDKEILSSVASTVAVSIELAELLDRTREFARELELKVEERTRELNQATKKLIQTEKYAATGRMGANLAHEINNPLGIIKNYLRLVSDGLQESSGGRRATDPNLAHLTIINEEINRIARIVRQLLDLHRPPEQTSLRTDITALLSDLVALMEKDLETSGIKINCVFESDLPRPLVAPDLMRQVFINLMRNAQDAMEDGGEMTIEVSARGASDGRNERPSLCVSIGDTGAGIDKQHLAQIFDPFFTTKASDKGTGLGLSVSYGIVQMYQGTIEAESELGKGTKMIVTIPVDPPARQEESAALRAMEDSPGGSPGESPADAERPPSSPAPSV